LGLFKQSKEMFQAATSPELGELYRHSKELEKDRPSMLDGIRQANALIEQTGQHRRTIPVRVDPDDPPVVMFDQTALATQASGGSAPAPGAIPVQDPTVRLERLAGLRERGLITESEFEAQKARILADL
jgi:hypothetical protein